MNLNINCEDFTFEDINKNNINGLYNLLSDNNSNNDILSKKIFFKNFTYEDYLDYLIVKSNKTLVYHGFCNLIDINYIDGYVYINVYFKDLSENVCCYILYKYIDYLFNIYPIRKVYYEVYLYEIKIASVLKKLGFNIEVKYKDYKYYNQRYYTKYLLTLNRGEFYDKK